MNTTETVNIRKYLLVTFSSNPADKYYNLVASGESEDVPGFVYPGSFVTSINEVKNWTGADSGHPWKLVRTGWDNVRDNGCDEENISRIGFHFNDLKDNEQKAIRMFCKADGIDIDFDFETNYPF